MVDASFGFDGSDPDDLADDLDALGGTITARLVEALETWTLLVEATAKRLVAVASGRLRSSLTQDVRRTGAAVIQASIGSNVEYAAIVETGRGPITADAGEVLHFTIDGEDIFAKSVGPAPPQPYLRPAIETHRSDLGRLVGEALDQAKADVN